MTDPSSGAQNRSPRWPWVVLVLGLIWTVLIRVPLIQNADDHLDSDLSVDGLTLIDAVHGHWRWHYPGTPHMGILPLLFSYPQALLFGTSAVTLVSGGTLIWLLIVTSTFWLAWKTYGPSVAAWAILPLVFSSTGTIWLSGRITGGHLLTLAWHTFAFVGLHACITKGGALRAAALGFWCGLGLYLDMMFLFTLFGLVPAAILGWFLGGRWRMRVSTIAAFAIAAVIGFLPHEIGRIVDPYDAYPSQFAATFEPPAIREHARLLGRYCLPRLIAGTELIEFDRLAERNQPFLAKVILTLTGDGTPTGSPAPHEWFAVLALVGFSLASVRLALDIVWAVGAPEKAIASGICSSSLLIVFAFLVNRNIFNSDNYRYLIYVLGPWSLGFALLMHGLFRRGQMGRAAAFVLTIALACEMTGSTLAWYREKLHYMEGPWRAVVVPRADWSKPKLWERYGPRGSEGVLAFEVPRDVTHVFGGYWDVYRMSFRSGKRIVGVPYPIYPNRFPQWSRGLSPDQGKLLVLGLRNEKGIHRWRTLPDTSRAIDELYDPSSRINWRSPFQAVWQNDGRNPAEIDRIRVVLPGSDQAGR